MTQEETDADIDVYDLAQRMAAGFQLSTAAQREVAAELLVLKADHDRNARLLERVNAAIDLLRAAAGR